MSPSHDTDCNVCGDPIGPSRFFIRAQRFMDAYRRGLSGKQAAWANKKYRGHRVLPDSILEDLEMAGISRI